MGKKSKERVSNISSSEVVSESGLTPSDSLVSVCTSNELEILMKQCNQKQHESHDSKIEATETSSSRFLHLRDGESGVTQRVAGSSIKRDEFIQLHDNDFIIYEKPCVVSKETDIGRTKHFPALKVPTAPAITHTVVTVSITTFI